MERQAILAARQQGRDFGERHDAYSETGAVDSIELAEGIGGRRRTSYATRVLQTRQPLITIHAEGDFDFYLPASAVPKAYGNYLIARALGNYQLGFLNHESELNSANTSASLTFHLKNRNPFADEEAHAFAYGLLLGGADVSAMVEEHGMDDSAKALNVARSVLQNELTLRSRLVAG